MIAMRGCFSVDRKRKMNNNKMIRKYVRQSLNDNWHRKITRMLVGVFLATTVMVVFVPFNPIMPSAGLDPSWTLSINQAVAQGLSFGNEIIFTYGPYASIITRFYHPATDQMILFGGVFLALVYSSILLYLAKEVNFLWVILLAFFLPVIQGRDALFFSHSFLLSLLVYRMTLPENHPNKLSFSRFSFIKISVYFFSLGLLPTIKGTLLVTVLVTMVLSAFFFWINKQKSLAFVALISPVLSFLLFWFMAGQRWSALPDFFISLGQIISGYTEAMAMTGSHSDIFLFVSAALVILLALVVQKPVFTPSKLFLFLSYAFFLFVAFKSGFVRHDGHALTAGDAILFSALLLPFVTKNKLLLPSFLLAIFAWGTITFHYGNPNPKAIYHRAAGNYVNAWQGLRVRGTERNYLSEEYERSLAEIQDEINIPVLEGTTDLYPYHQAYLIASNNAWNPRPVMQSYSAYTPLLAEINKNHLLGDDAPDNILFRVQAIDERFPALEDGLSWATIINNYSANSFIGPYIYFQKRTSHTTNEVFVSQKQPTVVYDGGGILNNWLELPKIQAPLLAEIVIEPTILGKFYALLYKPTEMRMKVTLNDGQVKDFRVVTAMLKSKFLLSPLIETTNDFVFLTGEQGCLIDRTIKRIKIYPIGPFGSRSAKWLQWIWKPTYEIKLSTLEFSHETDYTRLYEFSEIVDENALFSLDTSNTRCDGSIDQVNGSYLPAGVATLNISSILSINGDLSVIPSPGMSPDIVYVTLTDTEGNRLYLETQEDARKYLVNSHPQQAAAQDSSYEVYTDVSMLSGMYTLGVSYAYEGELVNCENLSVGINIESNP